MPTLAFLFVACLVAPSARARPTPSPADAVRAFYAQVDAMDLRGPVAPEVIGFTLDEQGAGLVAEGPAGFARIGRMLEDWRAAGGTIATRLDDLRCWTSGSVAGCAATAVQTCTRPGEPDLVLPIRGTFVLRADKRTWTIVHWHESAPPTPTSP